jgi:hypothetical protein
VLAEKLERALARELRGGGIVGAAVIAVESMLGGVDVHRLLRVRRLEIFHA